MSAAPPWRDAMPLAVLGTGMALPGEPVVTADLLELCEAKLGRAVRRRGEAIARKLGIATRHLCRPMCAPVECPRAGQRNPELAAKAVRAALRDAGVPVGDLGYLIGHTATPARPLPPNTAEVARLLGYGGPFAELRQACTGFVNALILAQGLLRAGDRPVAIVGSETGSVFFDLQRAAEDMGQLVNLLQMGDGAAAIVLGRADGGAPSIANVFHGRIGHAGPAGLCMAAGGSDRPEGDGGVLEFTHDFAAVRRAGGELLRQCANAAAEVGAMPAARILPHQANGRMATLVAPALGLAPSQVVVHADRVGNTGSAAIWLALAEQRRLAGDDIAVLGMEATGFMFGGFRYRHG